MLIDIVLYALQVVAGLFALVLPASDFWPLPSGITDGLAFFGGKIALSAQLLPDGTLAACFAALSLVCTVNLFVIPWLAARNFRLPFAAAAKNE